MSTSSLMRHMPKRTTYATLCAALWLCLIGITPLQARKVAYLNSENGLTGDNVQEIFKDSRGIVWIGTNEGINRYNGIDIVHYEASLPGMHRTVAHLAEMPDGTLVAGTRGGLYRINVEGQCYECLFDHTGVINALCLVGDTLLIGSREGLWIYRDETHLERIAIGETVVSRDNAINAMVTDDATGVWICTDEKLLHFDLPTRRITHYPIGEGLLNGYIRTLCRINTTLYIGPHTGRLFRFDCSNHDFAPCPDIPIANILTLATDGSSLLIGTNGDGAFRVDPATDRIVEHWHNKAPHTPLSGNTINKIFHDPEADILWWGIQRGGAVHELHRRPLFETYRYGDFDSSRHRIHSYCIQDSERLIATPEGLWYIDEGRDIVRFYERSLLGDINIRAITYFGGCYIIATKGLTILDPQTLQLRPLSTLPDVANGHYSSLCTLHGGNTLAASSNLGIVIIDSLLQVEYLYTQFNSPLPETYPVDIYTDSEDKTWVATTSQLCLLYDKRRHIQADGFPKGFFHRTGGLRFTRTAGTSPSTILAHTETEAYQCHSDLSTYHRTDLTPMLGNATVSFIAPYGDSYWVGTNKGLLLCDTAFCIRERYDASDGLPSLHMTGRGCTLTPDSTLWMATEEGLITLSPERRTHLHDKVHGTTALRHLRVGYQEKDNMSRHIGIPWNFGTPTLYAEPLLLDYAGQKHRHYEWSLDGQPYTSTCGYPSFTIGSLPLGRHTLRIRLLGHEETATAITLAVLPHVTFWLELALGISILCIAVIAVKYRRRKRQLTQLLRQKHQQELRIAAEQAVAAHREEEHRRLTAQEEERRQALQQRTQRSSEMHRTLATQVHTYLSTSKAYCNPSLRVADVATAVGTSTTNISEMCSMHLETSFFSFINKYRIEEFKRLVRDEQWAHYTVTALAEMCGFKKSSFFTTFKEHEGCTPATWMKREGIKRIG